MYKSIIEIKREVPFDILLNLRNIADSAFINRAGKVNNVSSDPYLFIYEGDEKDYGCLELGTFSFKRSKNFLSYVSRWQWIDEIDSGECCDILEIFRTPVR